jgi:hypothetical protein
VDASLQGRVGDATEEEKIRTTTTENEKEWVRARATWRTAVAGGDVGAKMTITEAAVEATAIAGGVDTGSATTHNNQTEYVGGRRKTETVAATVTATENGGRRRRNTRQ